MSNVIVSDGSSMWMNIPLNPFSVWSSYSFQTELAAFLVLDLENKQQPWHFLLNPTLHKFSFSVQVYFNLQQQENDINMFASSSKCQYVFTMIITLT